MRKLRAFIALAFATTITTACGASEEISTPPSTQNAAAEGRTQYPLHIENCGKQITFSQAPQRVVSLDQGSTEILLSLGLKDHIVGTASWTDPILPELEKANSTVPRLSDNAPTYEVVLNSDPDFITASFGRHYKKEGGVGSREKFTETNINTFLSPTDCEGNTSINGGGTRTTALSINTIYEEISTLAKIFDVQQRGEELIKTLKERVAYATNNLPKTDATVAFWFAETRSPYVAGGLGQAAILTQATGLHNVFHEEANDWPSISWENFVEQNPDYIVLGDLQRDRFPGDRLEEKKEFLATDPVTSQLKAVQEEKYIILQGAELNPSIRLADGIEKIATALKEGSDEK